MTSADPSDGCSVAAGGSQARSVCEFRSIDSSGIRSLRRRPTAMLKWSVRLVEAFVHINFLNKLMLFLHEKTPGPDIGQECHEDNQPSQA